VINQNLELPVIGCPSIFHLAKWSSVCFQLLPNIYFRSVVVILVFCVLKSSLLVSNSMLHSLVLRLLPGVRVILYRPHCFPFVKNRIVLSFLLSSFLLAKAGGTRNLDYVMKVFCHPVTWMPVLTLLFTDASMFSY